MQHFLFSDFHVSEALLKTDDLIKSSSPGHPIESISSKHVFALLILFAGLLHLNCM